MAAESVNRWSRILGVSLRPWSGHAPHSMVLKGLVQLALCIFLFVLVTRLPAETIGEVEQAGVQLRNYLWVVLLAFAVPGVLALARILVGVVDLVPRRMVVGQVASLNQRRTGDILPWQLQRLIFRRGQHLDNRRLRTEVVLHTDRGTRQWTVRIHRTRRALRVGSHVRMSVSPILGYVARVEPR